MSEKGVSTSKGQAAEDEIQPQHQEPVSQQPPTYAAATLNDGKKNTDEPKLASLLPLVTMSRMAGRNRREEDFRNFPHWIKRNIKMKVRIGESIRESHTDAAGMVEFRGVTRSARAKVCYSTT